MFVHRVLGVAAALTLSCAVAPAGAATAAQDEQARSGVEKPSVVKTHGPRAHGPESAVLDTVVAHRPSARASFAPYPMTMRSYLRYVGSDVNAFWSAAFSGAGMPYKPARQYALSRRQRVRTACGIGTSADGAFYCRNKVVLSVPWLTRHAYQDSRDFAVAIVVAHEWAHHAQQLDGILAAQRKGQLLSIHVELQADCLAGVWANSVYHRGMLDDGDFEEAVALAQEFQDAPGTPFDDPAAHGTAQQRVEWLLYGYETGSGADCTTW